MEFTLSRQLFNIATILSDIIFVCLPHMITASLAMRCHWHHKSNHWDGSKMARHSFKPNTIFLIDGQIWLNHWHNCMRNITKETGKRNCNFLPSLKPAPPRELPGKQLCNLDYSALFFVGFWSLCNTTIKRSRPSFVNLLFNLWWQRRLISS